jgi:hypothetical protein
MPFSRVFIFFVFDEKRHFGMPLLIILLSPVDHHKCPKTHAQLDDLVLAGRQQFRSIIRVVDALVGESFLDNGLTVHKLEP